MMSRLAVAALALSLSAGPVAAGDLSRIAPSKSDIAVGERVDIALKVGLVASLCAYQMKVAAPPGSGWSDQDLEITVTDQTSFKVKDPDGVAWNYGFSGFDVVFNDARFLAPGRYEIRVSSSQQGCRVKAPPAFVNVRPDYGPMRIGIYGRPGLSLVKRLDGGWTFAPGDKNLWITKTAARDLKAMADGYVPGAWAGIFPDGFAQGWASFGVKLKNVSEREWVYDDRPPLSEAGKEDDDRLLVLVLGREEQQVAEDVAAGRLVKVQDFSPEVFVGPLLEGARQVAEAERTRRARADSNRSRLGDPATLVGLRIGPLNAEAPASSTPRSSVR